MNELQTIREALEAIKRTPHHPDYDTYTHDYVCEALDALDILAADTSKDKRIAELEKELATPILVQVNRLVDALADAKARIAELEAKAK